jgi:hypothetical protein
MVEAFVKALRLNPEADALTCYLLAFRDGDDPAAGDWLYCYNPAGGPHLMAGVENVYGDSNAALRTEALRSAGGFEEDRACAGWEDWMTFVRLVNAGRRVEVIPEPLFWYRVRAGGQLREASGSRAKEYALSQTLLRKHFSGPGGLSAADRAALWTTLVSFARTLPALQDERDRLRVEMEGWRGSTELARAEAADWRGILEDTRQELDRVRAWARSLEQAIAGQSAAMGRAVYKLSRLLGKVPLLRGGVKGAMQLGGRAWRFLRRAVSSRA